MPGKGWRKLEGGRNEFVDDFDDDQLPGQAAEAKCNVGTRGKDGFGTGVWVYRAGENVWVPVKSVQTVPNMNYTLTMTAEKLPGASGAVSLGGKVTGVDIGGLATVKHNESYSYSESETIRDARRRRVVEMPIVYREFHFKVGCGYNSQTKKYREVFEYREAIPTRFGRVGLRLDPEKDLKLVQCDGGLGGKSSKHQGGEGKGSGGFERTKSKTRVADVGASIKLLGLGLTVGLNTADTTSVSERVELLGDGNFRACTWAKFKGGKYGEPAWEIHPEETWLWND